MLVSFKRTDTGAKFDINLENNINIKNLRNIINDKVKDNFNLSEYVIIKTNQELMENGESIDELTDLPIEKYFGYNDYYSFYIRPGKYKGIIQHEIENCCICYQNFRYFTNINILICVHSRNFCQNCFSSWKNNCVRNNREITCPLCRNNI